MEIQFVDLNTQYEQIRNRVNDNINRVLTRGSYIQGAEVKSLEEELKAFVGAEHCIGVASGTDALLIALMALQVGPGDEVITTPFSFIATAEVIALLGAKPVYADIDPKTYNVDPTDMVARITNRTKAIVAVSLYGQCADFDAINATARQHALPVIEDAAQSFGATYRGRRSCGLSTIGCTSFFPSKPLGCYGDGGAIFTDDPELARTMSEIRVHGQDRRYHHARLGINGRLDEIQAAVLLAKLPLFEDEEIVARQEKAQCYDALLKEAQVVLPAIEAFNSSVYAQYTVQVADRERVQGIMKRKGIPTAVHYPIPLYRQPALHQEDVRLPHTEYASARVMSLPMHPYLSHEQQEFVAGVLREAAAQATEHEKHHQTEA